MQLVKIDHERCGEYSAWTFVTAPDEWTSGVIRERVRAAQDAYLVEFEKASTGQPEPPRPGYQPAYAKSPDRLVRDVLAEFEAAKAIHDAWLASRYRTRTTFESFLLQQGFVSLSSEESGAVEVDVDWGHRHGQRLSYGADEIDTMPSPGKLAGVSDYEDDDFA